MENGVEVFNFGKFKGRPVADVLRAEPQYYDWMMKGDFPAAYQAKTYGNIHPYHAEKRSDHCYTFPVNNFNSNLC